MNTRGRYAEGAIGWAPRAPKGQEAETQSGSASVELEDFERRLRISIFSQGSQARLPAKLQIHGTGRLADMIETVRKAQLACLEGLEDCNARARQHWHRASAGGWRIPIDGPDREALALQRENESWGQKIRWLEELRLSLENKRVPRLRESKSRPVYA
jgi:hypothetical protein